MVGEEKMSLRKRLSKSSEDAEEKEERQGDRSEEPLEILSNGRNDLKQLIAKKIQLTAEAEELKPFFMKEVGNHFDDFVTNLIEKSTSLDNGGCSLTSFSVLGENHHRANELFEVDHIRTIYHMFIALFILFILSTLVVDYIDEGRLVLDFNLMSYAFGKFPTVVLGFGPPYVVLAYTLPPASRCIIILEQIRLIMKAYSFVRENVPRVLNSAKEKSSTVPIPTVNQYLYFLFAPTLIYRDNYPRLCGPLFRNIKEEPFSARVLVLCVFNSILPGVLIQLLIFFAFLHCWLNAFAEMLRFGDRMFYKDWWNSTSYSNYYRTWNVVVHDWLYYYAYKDFLWFFTKKFRSAAMLAVFAVSAVVHEYALALCLNFFYPVLFVLFMFFGSKYLDMPYMFFVVFLTLVAFNFLVNDSRKRPIWNVLMWASLFTGHGVILCFYSQEWYARQRCPLKNNEFIPEEVLLSLTYAANAGPCPENLLPPKKSKTPKVTLPRLVDHVWQNPIRRNKFRYLIDHPVSLTGAGRDISFLYDVKYVKGETKESTVCPPQTNRPLQSHDGAIVPHKPKKLTDTLIPEEFHIVSNTGVSGLECYDEKPNKRVEVVQLNDVMDTMLERAGVENQEYTGPTKMHKLLHILKKEQTIYNTVFHELIRQVSVDCADRGELLSKIRERYVQLLDQLARQMIDFYKDMVTQRVIDQRILEELYNFKNVIEELTRELCLVRAHDVKLTKEAERAHRDLAQALLDAEKNANGKDILSPDKENIFKSVVPDFKEWQKMLNEDKDKFSGDLLVSKYDSLKIIKCLQENWADIGLAIFSRHKSVEGKIPPEQKHMEEIVKSIGRLYKEFEIRINGDNGISKILPSLITSLEFCSFKLESLLEFPEMLLEEWEGFNEKMNEMKSQLDALLSIIGTVPQNIDMDSGSCCKDLVTAMALSKEDHLEKNPAKELHELNKMKGTVKGLSEPETDKSLKEDEEGIEDKKFEEEKEEEKAEEGDPEVVSQAEWREELLLPFSSARAAGGGCGACAQMSRQSCAELTSRELA
ncbi:hypothetical protein CB1_000644002 [Camelus ferus]|nr:hypothetical protein CB1_000644002 [Camelus ferus]